MLQTCKTVQEFLLANNEIAPIPLNQFKVLIVAAAADAMERRILQWQKSG
jgi:hypothetical protein